MYLAACPAALQRHSDSWSSADDSDIETPRHRLGSPRNDGREPALVSDVNQHYYSLSVDEGIGTELELECATAESGIVSGCLCAFV